jgi:hypothetical protein
MRALQLIGPAYLSRSRNFDASRLVNLYPEASGSGQSKAVAMLIGTPGLKPFTTAGTGGIQGMLRFSATQAVVVSGSNVYLMDPAGAVTLLGAAVVTNSPISMASNGTVVMLVTGVAGYVINPLSATMVQIVDPAFIGADRVDFVDGYFVFNKPGTGQFQITGLQTTSIDPLDFATAEGSPDLLLSLVVDHREIWLFGETSTEVFFNSGDNDFPFSRIQGAFIQQGIAAKFTAVRFADSLAWLSFNEEGQGMVVKSQGYQAVRISTHALEFAIAQYPRIDDAFSFSYQQEGHRFLVMTFPSGNATWVYDDSTQLWHERAWRNPADASLNRHRAQCMMAFANKILVGDFATGAIYQWDLDTYSDNGDPLPAIRQVPHVASDSNVWQFFRKLWVDMETGVGLTTGQGSDPQVMLTWSDDGGHTFPVANERWASFGKIGEYRRRVNFRRLGRSRDRVFRLTITDPVKRILIGAGCVVDEGTN